MKLVSRANLNTSHKCQNAVRKHATYMFNICFCFYLSGINCPTPVPSNDNFVLFTTPTISGFSPTNIVYSGTGVTTTTLPRTQAQHFLLNLPVGLTQVTASATGSGQTATCTFYYSRTTNGQCKCLSDHDSFIPIFCPSIKMFFNSSNEKNNYGLYFCRCTCYFRKMCSYESL